jgi:thioredoxin 1
MTIATIDIESGKKIAMEFGVKELPMYLFFKNGQLIDHIVGAVSKGKLTTRIKLYFNNSN